jgi:hypothetical protein
MIELSYKFDNEGKNIVFFLETMGMVLMIKQNLLVQGWTINCPTNY